MKNIIITLIAGLPLLACAKTPSNITPVAVPSGEYSEYSCAALSEKQGRIQADLEAASKTQRRKVAGDAVSVGLILVPISKIAGDKEGTIAQLKGEAVAIDRAIDQRGC